MNRAWLAGLAAFGALALLSGCARSAAAVHAEPATATANMIDARGRTIGTARLAQLAKGVLIRLDLRDVAPGVHAFHIHEKGLCETPDFKSAGGHFNPGNARHGFDNPRGPHAGDLPNVIVGKDGTLQVEFVAERATLAPGRPNSLLSGDGSALMLHAKADDYRTDPAGDAGARIACGVVRAADER